MYLQGPVELPIKTTKQFIFPYRQGQGYKCLLNTGSLTSILQINPSLIFM